ncbi:DUF4079 domain-containing protein [Myxacorys almedinensis]|uniref:DUF4079 family protein n=1 Tax=Myxacorys almedinensis A TaxID=2690445 RepID=A0A8J7Z4V1_9CYAN|nr:DUF4079 domain-containing protein [Myxacorys almedinensis]NDJ18211.1 DUF4079 family protein [Myxacorys almedinensis A]
MDLPSFIWLWKLAAWSMGLAIAAYLLQAITGLSFLMFRSQDQPSWLRPLHRVTGGAIALLILILLAIGIVGTLGHYGSLGHSSHLFSGLTVVELVFLSAWSAAQIRLHSWARLVHLTSNFALCIALLWASITGWEVVQKYL